MTARLVARGTIWVCVDCTVADVNGELPTDRPATEPEVWALWQHQGEYDVTPGMVRAEHSEACTVADGDECDCERITYSTAPCGGCGSTLAGAREAFTYWTP